MRSRYWHERLDSVENTQEAYQSFLNEIADECSSPKNTSGAFGGVRIILSDDAPPCVPEEAWDFEWRIVVSGQYSGGVDYNGVEKWTDHELCGEYVGDTMKEAVLDLLREY